MTVLVLTGSVTTKDKFDSITSEQSPPGSVIVFTADELVVFARQEMDQRKLEGIQKIGLRFGEGTANANAMVEFAKLPQFESLSSNWLLASLLSGEKPVTVDLQVDSADGLATILVRKLKISETEFEGGTLDFLVENLLHAVYPDARIGEPFELDHNVEQIRLRPSGAHVKIAD